VVEGATDNVTTSSPTAPRVAAGNRKAKGSRNERRTMRLLETAGYVCLKAGASLGVFDVVGIGSTDVVLVQCKTRDWPSGAEIERMRAFAAPANARKLVHRWRDRQTVPDVREVA
jgi:Holliday junction resolvase